MREWDEAAARQSYVDLGDVGLHYVEAGDAGQMGPQSPGQLGTRADVELATLTVRS